MSQAISTSRTFYFGQAGYRLDPISGAVYQTNPKPFTYSPSYLDGYSQIPQQTRTSMAFLRRTMFEIGMAEVFKTSKGMVWFKDHRQKAVLELGFGLGDFLKTFEKMNTDNLDLFGYDPSRPKCSFEFEHATILESEKDCYSRSYLNISLFDVLEHLDNPYSLSRFDTLSYLITVPNAGYLTEFLARPDYKHLKPDEHLWHFNQDTLIKFMKHLGYSCKWIVHSEDLIRQPAGNTSTPNTLTGFFIADAYVNS